MRVTQTADLAAAPLTQNDDRKDVVQFLEPPFMTFDLAMLMKKDHQSSDVVTISDLNKQETKYRYGFVADGSTYRYFERSPYTYMQPYHGMDLPQNVEEGVQRVRGSTKSQPYVFIGEQQMLEYHASQKPCDLVVLQGNATTGKYHLAVQNNYNQNIVNMLKGALGKLNETGRLDELYNKWWNERSQCQEPSSSTVIGSGAAILVSMLLAVLLRVSGE